MAAVFKALTAINIPATGRHTATVIFIHGLGDTGFGWKPVADMFASDPSLTHIKWVLPHSPTQPVTANMGIEMPSWFDIYHFGFDADEDEGGMLKSRRLIDELITREVDAGIDPSRIVLGGFSQGGTMSLLTGLTGERKLAGLAVLSSWLPLRAKFKAMASEHAKSVPIFWGHGSTDPLVKLALSKASAKFLWEVLGIPRCERPGFKGLQYNIYDGVGHSTSEEELDDLKKWLTKVLPADT